jgi:O-acetyl-ADP-ribose deacetylase (regulator of RNase III)
MSITYLQGDATCPQGDGLKIIVHIVNDLGAWGHGFVVALSERWKEPERAYRKWYRDSGIEQFKEMLGDTQFVKVEDDILVVNLIGQVGLRATGGYIPVRYEAIRKGLSSIAKVVSDLHTDKKITVHMPRIGCGLAGGSWSKVLPVIEDTLAGIDVIVYDLPGSHYNP